MSTLDDDLERARKQVAVRSSADLEAARLELERSRRDVAARMASELESARRDLEHARRDLAERSRPKRFAAGTAEVELVRDPPTRER